MCFVIIHEIFPIKPLKSLSITKLEEVLVLKFRGFLSSETQLFFVKMHIIHALAETTW